MGTRKNLLGDLRKNNGHKLSQGQIAIRMGVDKSVISKFECGSKECSQWSALNLFRYADADGLDPRLVFVTRYPDEPYSKKFLEMQREEQIMSKRNELSDHVEPLKTAKDDGNTFVVAVNPRRHGGIPCLSAMLMRNIIIRNPDGELHRAINDKITDGISDYSVKEFNIVANKEADKAFDPNSVKCH